MRAVLTKLELGQGDAAFVYATDAALSEDVTQVALPDGAAAKATYNGSVIKGSAGGQAFMDWLLRDEAQGVFADFGFTPPPSS